jgi:colanic acid biosynthesis protein WcaH
MSDNWIPADDWQTIVANVPIVSVDLFVRYDGGLLFGKRANEPAKGWWFPPGGRVHKGETRMDAVHRVADKELGLTVELVESLGAFEHIYDTADVLDAAGKHYLANGYVVDAVGGELMTDAQHENVRSFTSPPEPLHEYVVAYLNAANTLPEWP